MNDLTGRRFLAVDRSIFLLPFHSIFASLAIRRLSGQNRIFGGLLPVWGKPLGTLEFASNTLD
jgi:hypothetical protein